MDSDSGAEALAGRPTAPARADTSEPSHLLAPEVAGRLVAVALAMGVIGQTLFFEQRLGLNLPIWTALLLLASWLTRPSSARLDRLDVWLPVSAMVFAAFVALRADPSLLAFDTLAVIGLAGASVPALAGVPVTRRALLPLTALATRVIGAAVGGATMLRSGTRPLTGAARSVPLAAVRRVLVGLVLALPIVLVFAALFATADAVFARVVGDALRLPIDLGSLPARIVLALVLAWLVGGWLGFSADAERVPADRLSVRLPQLGSTEATVVLLAVDAVFALFVILQATYLFGGRETLELTGMTYSAYARQGFFELICVAALAGGLVLALEAFAARRTPLRVGAAVALAVLTAVVLASAFVRLQLYQQAYGWTELRFHAVAAIVWLALGVVAAVVTLLRARVRWLIHALVMSGLLVAAGVNVIGPRAFVTERNVERALDPRLVPMDGETGLDASYLAGLGDDAIPVLVAALPRLPAADAEQLRDDLRSQRARLARQMEGAGWQSWNLSRQRAWDALRSADLE